MTDLSLGKRRHFCPVDAHPAFVLSFPPHSAIDFLDRPQTFSPARGRVSKVQGGSMSKVSLLRVTSFALLLAAIPVAFAQTAGDRFTSVTTLAGGKTTPPLFHRPSGVAIDPDTGNLYLTDTKNHQVKLVTPRGEILVVAGSGVPGLADGVGRNAQFHEPSGLALDRDARVLYVADRNNHAIRRVTLDGVVSLFAGTGKRGFVPLQGFEWAPLIEAG